MLLFLDPSATCAASPAAHLSQAGSGGLKQQGVRFGEAVSEGVFTSSLLGHGLCKQQPVQYVRYVGNMFNMFVMKAICSLCWQLSNRIGTFVQNP